MDLEDSDALAHVPSRVSRFAPKSSKKLNAKPKPKSEPQELDAKPSLDQSPFCKPEPQQSDPVGESPSPKPEPKEEPKCDITDDPIVDDGETVLREIDVFFRPSSSIDPHTQLYVMQYPMRSKWRPYEFDERCEEVRLKPESSQVEIDFFLDVESINYDKASSSSFQKQTLSSNSWNPRALSNTYAVGFFTDNTLHLQPTHAVLQLRPSLQRKNNTTKKQKNTVNQQTHEEEESKSSDWVSLKYHGSKSDVSAVLLKKMVAQQETVAPISFTMSPCDYVTSLCPKVSNNNLTKTTKGGLIRSMLALPLQERLKKLLLEGRTLHRFSAVKYFAPECSDEELTVFLQRHAVLVQGLWAPKSELLYPTGSVEDLARDYVMLLFSKSLKVRFSQVNVRQEYARRVKNFLGVFGEERSEAWKSGVQPAVYWRFRERPDVSFDKLYPNVVAKQREVLKGMEQKVFGEVQRVEKGELDKSTYVAKRSLKNNIRPPARQSNETRQTGNVGKQK